MEVVRTGIAITDELGITQHKDQKQLHQMDSDKVILKRGQQNFQKEYNVDYICNR